ncbi:MAG: phytanoyl-CoA dioxygenase family protein [Bacillota bacterium]
MSKSINLTDTDLQFFRRNGYLIVREVFQKGELERLKKIFNNVWLDKIKRGEILQKEEYPLESLYPRIGNYHLKNPIALKFALDKRILDILSFIIGEDPLLLQTVYYFKPPGGRGLYTHQDNYEIGAHPGTCYGAWISISPSRKENGGMYVVPGSHNLDLIVPKEVENGSHMYKFDIPIPEGYKVVDLYMGPGDVVIFGGNLLHGSYQNVTSDQFRHSFVGHFAASSVEMLTMYRNSLFNAKGERVRKKYNMNPKTNEANRTNPTGISK